MIIDTKYTEVMKPSDNAFIAIVYDALVDHKD